MPGSRALIALLLCGAAARAAEVQPIIDRPPTLPQGKVDLTLHGTYTNWGGGAAGVNSFPNTHRLRSSGGGLDRAPARRASRLHPATALRAE